MTTRLAIHFAGAPEEDTLTFQEVLVNYKKDVPFSKFAQWKIASKVGNIWKLEIDAVPLVRVATVFIVPTENVSRDDLDAACVDICTTNAVPLRLYESVENPVIPLLLQKKCVDVCDRLFVVNPDGRIDEKAQSVIDYATEIGKPTVYLRY